MINNYFDLLDNQLEGLGKKIDMQLDIFKLVIYFYLNIPGSLLMRKITNPHIRSIYSLVLCLFYLYFLGREWFTYILSVAFSIYFTIKIKTNHQYVVCVFLAFVGLSYVHIYRILYDYNTWKMDFSTIQMIVTCRLVYYAYDQTSDTPTKHNLIEYISYAFMFTNLQIAPVTFKDWVNFIHLKNQYSKIQYNNSWIISLIKAIAFSLGEIIVRPFFDASYIHTEEFTTLNIIHKFVLMNIIGVCCRFKYYAGFCYTQSALDGLGITYNGINEKGEHTHNRYITFDIRYETDPNCIVKTGYWNTMVQTWLKTCFYDKTYVFGQQVAFYVTFLISAIWHGFYMTYYFFFFWWAVLNQISKYFFKASDKFKNIPPIVRYVVSLSVTTTLLNCFALSVVALDWERGMYVQNQVYWIPAISTLALFGFFFFTQYGQKNSKKEKKI